MFIPKRKKEATSEEEYEQSIAKEVEQEEFDPLEPSQRDRLPDMPERPLPPRFKQPIQKQPVQIQEPVKPSKQEPEEDMWQLGEIQQIPTSVAIINAKTGEKLDVLSALVKILNTLEYFKTLS